MLEVLTDDPGKNTAIAMKRPSHIAGKVPLMPVMACLVIGCPGFCTKQASGRAGIADFAHHSPNYGISTPCLGGTADWGSNGYIARAIYAFALIAHNGKAWEP